MIRDDCEPHFKVLIRVQVVCFCSLYKTVDHCAGFCPMVGLDQNKALLPDRKGADGPLGRVVVHRDVTIGKELPEILLLVDSVAEGISNRPVLCYLSIFQLSPLKIGIKIAEGFLLMGSHGRWSSLTFLITIFIIELFI